jgi:hypothetical protein
MDCPLQDKERTLSWLEVKTMPWGHREEAARIHFQRRIQNGVITCTLTN